MGLRGPAGVHLLPRPSAGRRVGGARRQARWRCADPAWSSGADGRFVGLHAAESLAVAFGATPTRTRVCTDRNRITGPNGGSAIAIAPPIVARRAPGSTHLYVGVRTPADTPLLDELRAWRAAGFAVTLCASRDVDGDVGLPVARAYVQDVIARDRVTIGAPATVLVAGPDGLVAAVRALGGDDLSVYTNV